MIFHEYKCIFIHIPKCAGTTITRFFSKNTILSTEEPNYDILFGWCPERKIHMQHATSKQLIETGLISKKNWEEYFKFTIVRNPWDKAYSDYLWMKKELNLDDTFSNFINKKGKFKNRLTELNIDYRGDHLQNQTDFFDVEGKYKLDLILRFENLKNDFEKLKDRINFNDSLNIHYNKSQNRHSHYSKFYNSRRKEIIDVNYKKDIELLNYSFKDKKSIIDNAKLLFS